MKKVAIAEWAGIKDREPSYALVANVDLVVIRYDEEVSVLYGRCLHRGALLSDGFIEGRCPNRSQSTPRHELIGSASGSCNRHDP